MIMQFWVAQFNVILNKHVVQALLLILKLRFRLRIHYSLQWKMMLNQDMLSQHAYDAVHSDKILIKLLLISFRILLIALWH